MKFTIGDEIDSGQCSALQDEFVRLRLALNSFKTLATIAIVNGQDLWLSPKTRHAYLDFVRCLYEFLHGAHVREARNTKIANKELDEAYISCHAQRLLTKTRSAIQNGTAPVWENDVSYYPEKIPVEFANAFREYRNKGTHVSHERLQLDVPDFYEKYHKYLLLLYRDCCWWRSREEKFA